MERLIGSVKGLRVRHDALMADVDVGGYFASCQSHCEVFANLRPLEGHHAYATPKTREH